MVITRGKKSLLHLNYFFYRMLYLYPFNIFIYFILYTKMFNIVLLN